MKKWIGISLLVGLLGSVLAESGKPNFVIIFTDDQGYADLSCFGGTHVSTPRIDRMAEEGAKLTSFYVAGECPHAADGEGHFP